MRQKSNRLEIAKQMPPLYHTLPGEDFDWQKSEVVQWLVSQPEILAYLFDKVRNSHEFITYNPQTGKWQGVDDDDPVLHSV